MNKFVNLCPNSECGHEVEIKMIKGVAVISCPNCGVFEG